MKEPVHVRTGKRGLTAAIRIALLAPGLVLATAAQAGDTGAPSATMKDAAQDSLSFNRLRDYMLGDQRVVPLKPGRVVGNAPSSLLVVTSALDDGSPGTLRSAIEASNASFGSRDTIVFDNALSGATINLALPLEVTDGVDILGPPDRVRVNGLGGAPLSSGLRLMMGRKGIGSDVIERVFTIGDGTPLLDSSVTMERLDIRGGVVVDFPGPVPNGSGINAAIGIGGGIYSSESLTLRDCVVAENEVGAVNQFSGGAAIFVRGGDLTLEDTLVTGNHATAIPSLGATAPEGGAPTAIAASYGILTVIPELPPAPIAPSGTTDYGHVTLIDTTISDNSSEVYSIVPGSAAQFVAAGVVFYASLHANRVIISDNFTGANAAGEPGIVLSGAIASGLYATRGERNELYDSRISGNVGVSSADFTAQGVATVVLGALINDIQRTQISGNFLYASNRPQLPDPYLSNSAALAGGAALFGSLGQITLISDSTISGNITIAETIASADATTADLSAGLAMQLFPAVFNPYVTRISNSTLSGNAVVGDVVVEASVDGAFNITGQVLSTASGGAALLSAEPPPPQPNGVPGLPSYGGEVLNSTIASNLVSLNQTVNYTGTTTGTLFNEVAQAAAAGLTFQGASGGLLASSIVNTNDVVGNADIFAQDVSALGLSASNNFVTDMAGSSLTDGVDGNVEGDAGLAPLANNGGPTPTHALLAGSPAIDAGSNLLGLGADQRGQLTRAVGAAADVGAFECGAVEFIPDTLLRDGFDPYCE